MPGLASPFASLLIGVALELNKGEGRLITYHYVNGLFSSGFGSPSENYSAREEDPSEICLFFPESLDRLHIDLEPDARFTRRFALANTPILCRRFMEDDENIFPGNSRRAAKVPDNGGIEFLFCLKTPALERNDLDNDKLVTLIRRDLEIVLIEFIQLLVPVMVRNEKCFNQRIVDPVQQGPFIPGTSSFA
jgi:hypothetical protein